MLFAALPDRIHAEVLSPLGRPQLILDGGDGRVAVTFVRDGESFVGPASAASLESALGVSIELEDLVRGLWTGRKPGAGAAVERRSKGGPGLPEHFEIETATGALVLELKHFRPLQVDPSTLGRGEPPAGTRIRPIDELEGQGERLEAVTDEEGT